MVMNQINIQKFIGFSFLKTVYLFSDSMNYTTCKASNIDFTSDWSTYVDFISNYTPGNKIRFSNPLEEIL